MEEKLKSLKAECDRLCSVYVQAQKEHRTPRDIRYLEDKYFKELNKYNKALNKYNKASKMVEG